MKRFLCILLLYNLVVVGMDIVPFKSFEVYDLQEQSVLDCLPSELFYNVVLSVVFSGAEKPQESDTQSLANWSEASKKYANVLQSTDCIKKVVECAVQKYDVAHEWYCERLKKIPALKKIFVLNEQVHHCMLTKQSDDIIFEKVNNAYCIPDYIYSNGCTHVSHALFHSKPLLVELLLTKGSKSPVSVAGYIFPLKNGTHNSSPSVDCECIGDHFSALLDYYMEEAMNINTIDSFGFTMITTLLLPRFKPDRVSNIITFIKLCIAKNANPELQITQGDYKGCNAFDLAKKLHCSENNSSESKEFGEKILQILKKP